MGGVSPAEGSDEGKWGLLQYLSNCGSRSLSGDGSRRTPHRCTRSGARSVRKSAHGRETQRFGEGAKGKDGGPPTHRVTSSRQAFPRHRRAQALPETSLATPRHPRGPQAPHKRRKSPAGARLGRFCSTVGGKGEVADGAPAAPEAFPRGIASARPRPPARQAQHCCTLSCSGDRDRGRGLHFCRISWEPLAARRRRGEGDPGREPAIAPRAGNGAERATSTHLLCKKCCWKSHKAFLYTLILLSPPCTPHFSTLPEVCAACGAPRVGVPRSTSV